MKRIEKIRIDEIRANIGEKIGEAILRWLGHVERNNEEDVVMMTWNTDVSGQRHIGRFNSRWSDARRKKWGEGRSADKRSTITENVDNENSMRTPYGESKTTKGEEKEDIIV